MKVNPISFGKEYKTKDIAEIVGGRQASGKLISEMSGIPEHTMLTRYSIDIFKASSYYIGTKVIEQHPEFAPIREVSKRILEVLDTPMSKENSKKCDELTAQKQTIIKDVCDKNGETIDIEPVSIDILV